MTPQQHNSQTQLASPGRTCQLSFTMKLPNLYLSVSLRLLPVSPADAKFWRVRRLLCPAAASQPCRDRNAAVLTRFWQVVEQNLRLPLRDAST